MVGDRFCLWSGVGFVVFYGLGFVLLAGFMPAPSPSLDAEQIASIYRENPVQMRFGVAVMLLASGLMLPFLGLISAQMSRIKNCGQALVNTQMVCGVMGAAVVMFSALFWGWAAFRPERDAQLIQLMNDLGWLCLFTTVSGPVIQPAVIGIAILGDQSQRPVFPRWGGYFNLWVAVLFAPGVIALFFKSGPFAWNGLFPYWLPFVAFASWYLTMFWLLRSSLKQGAPG